MSVTSGEFVRLKSEPSRAGIVQDGVKLQAGLQMVPVQFSDGHLSWIPEQSLEPVTIALEDMATRFAKGTFVDPGWLRRTLTRTRVTGQQGDVVYSMEATDTDFYAYQFKPVLKLLGAPTDSILIADEVGLGKTIEAGLIWTELRARFDANRLLVICPKTLREKWREELDHRFGVDAQIVDAKDLLRLLEDNSVNQRGFAAIASMQGLRPPRGWNLEDEPGQAAVGDTRRKLALFLEEAATNDPLIDLIVIDEAHHMRNPSTQLYQFGELINDVSSFRVFLSATPIHLRNRDLNSLLRLVDEDTFEFEETLEDLISANEPIVIARDLLMRTDSTKQVILEQIIEAQKVHLLSNSKSLQLLADDISHHRLDNTNRARFATRLENVNLMSNYVTRTRRRDVEDLKVVREPKAPLLEMHETEKEFYDDITDEVTRYALDSSINARFLLSSPQRLLTSCPAAASYYWENFGSYEIDETEETDNDLIQNDIDERPLLHALSLRARELKFSKRLRAVDTKYKLLNLQLTELWREEPKAKILIFSSFKPTLHYLKERLNKDGVDCELLHGSVKEPREEILRRFKEDPEKLVLLSSEVGSEGVDLQFSWIVVNYDLPWNPMKIEQRIGRVDRLGQQKKKVIVLNFVYEGTIDAMIYSRLFERLKLTERALGEFEGVLGDPIREMTNSLLNPHLTNEQKEQVVDQTAQAIENNKINEEKLEMDAGALIQHGDYILKQIYESRELNRWVSGNDILVYTKDRLSMSFRGCAIEASPPGSELFRITLSDKARQEFEQFLGRRRYRGSTRLLHVGKDQVYKFTSSVAKRRDKQTEYVSQFHPLVRFCVELDAIDNETVKAEPVAVTLSQNFAPDECGNDIHIVAIRKWQVTSSGDQINNATQIAYVGAELNSSKLLTPKTSEALIGAVVRKGKLLSNFAADDRLASAHDLLRGMILPELDRQYEEFLKQTQASNDDRANVRERALVKHQRTKAKGFRERSEKLKIDAKSASQSGDTRRSQQLNALARAAEVQSEKLKEKTDRRLQQINSQRAFVPEYEDLSFVLVEIE